MDANKIKNLAARFREEARGAWLVAVVVVCDDGVAEEAYATVMPSNDHRAIIINAEIDANAGSAWVGSHPFGEQRIMSVVERGPIGRAWFYTLSRTPADAGSIAAFDRFRALAAEAAPILNEALGPAKPLYGLDPPRWSDPTNGLLYRLFVTAQLTRRTFAAVDDPVPMEGMWAIDDLAHRAPDFTPRWWIAALHQPDLATRAANLLASIVTNGAENETTPADDNGEQTDDEEAKIAKLPKRAKKARDQYLHVCESANLSNPTDREIYDLMVAANNEAPKRKRNEPYPQLPMYEAWARNLRLWRKETGQNKAASRDVRLGDAATGQSGSSIVCSRDVRA
jgi:hypothetical protein